MYRQGDILLIPFHEELPEDRERIAREGLRVVLAHGEATGHAHALLSPAATLYQADDERFLMVRWRAALRHQEHDRIILPKGVYRVVRQQEYPDVVVWD